MGMINRRLLPVVVAVTALVRSGCGLVDGGGRPPSDVVRSTSDTAEVDSPHRTVSAVVRAQSAALLAGDEHGWLADVDSGRPGLVETCRLLYRNLRAMVRGPVIDCAP
jgi:hypothetical protein